MPCAGHGGRGSALVGRRSRGSTGRLRSALAVSVAQAGRRAAAARRPQPRFPHVAARGPARDCEARRDGASRPGRRGGRGAERAGGRLRQAGWYEEALAHGEQALEIFRALGDRRSEALTLNGIGLTQARIGDETGALDSYETAVALLSELGDSHGAGRVLANLGALHLGQGQDEQARPCGTTRSSGSSPARRSTIGPRSSCGSPASASPQSSPPGRRPGARRTPSRAASSPAPAAPRPPGA